MKARQSTQDQVEGAARNIKGKLKRAAGVVTANRELEREGKADEVAGKVQKKVGEVEKVFGK